MMCQFCGKHEATNKFHVNFMGLNRDVFLCDECLNSFKQYAGMAEGHEIGISHSKQGSGTQSTWPIGFGMPEPKERKLGEDPFNVDAGKEIRMKRRLNQLHKQLSNAVEEERYEDAAELRDKINDIKKEVYINGK